MTAGPALPSEFASIDRTDGSIALALDASVYSLEAVYAATFATIDRAYVWIDRPSADRYRVVLTPKKPETDLDAQLTQLAGELANELLAAAYRLRLHAEHRSQIEAITMRAVAGAMGPASLDDLESFDFSSEAFEDPLGIALSWEEKYGKKTPPAAGEAPPKASSSEGSEP